MCNKNVVFAKIQLDNLYMQVPVIDFLSNITSKIIMQDSNHSYDRKKKHQNIIFMVIEILSVFVVFSSKMMGYVKKIKYSLQRSVF